MGRDDQVGESGTPTERAIQRVQHTYKRSRRWALDYIAASHRGNLICLDCGSENHTRGADWCTYFVEGDLSGSSGQTDG